MGGFDGIRANDRWIAAGAPRYVVLNCRVVFHNGRSIESDTMSKILHKIGTETHAARFSIEGSEESSLEELIGGRLACGIVASAGRHAGTVRPIRREYL